MRLGRALVGRSAPMVRRIIQMHQNQPLWQHLRPLAFLSFRQHSSCSSAPSSSTSSSSGAFQLWQGSGGLKGKQVVAELNLDVIDKAFVPSAATSVVVEAIRQDAGERITGTGVDWGAGTGALTVACSRFGEVVRVVGLDITEENVACGRHNARRLGLQDKVGFYRANSYAPMDPAGAAALADIRGRCDFIVANPPASDGDDGWGFRRAVLAGSGDYLKPQGWLLMQWLSYYGFERALRFAPSVGMRFHGVAAESSWVPLWDAGNPAEREQHLSMLLGYVLEEEARGGLRYTGHPRWFTSADARAGADPTTHPNRTDRIDSCTTMSARETLAYVEETEMPPLCKWTGNWFQRRHVN